MFLFWFKRALVILGQIWWSYFFFSRAHFISFVYTLTLLMDSTEEGHICRPQNLSQFYFYINFKPNFILRFKSRLHLNCLARLHHLILSFYYFLSCFIFIFICYYHYYYYYYIFIFIFIFYFFSFLYPFSSLFLFLFILPTPLTPLTHSLPLHV